MGVLALHFDLLQQNERRFVGGGVWVELVGEDEGGEEGVEFGGGYGLQVCFVKLIKSPNRRLIAQSSTSCQRLKDLNLSDSRRLGTCHLIGDMWLEEGGRRMSPIK
jgi:hypothetical protein